MVTDFGRVITAMVTPFNDDFSVNYEGAAKLANYLVETGTETIVVCGTTGEAPTLFDPERKELFRTVVGAVGNRALVIAGTGCNCTADTLNLSKEAQSVGAHGVLLVCPYYNKPSQEGLYRHFSTVANGIDIPVMLYNIPGRTGVNLLPDTVSRLAKIPNIVALKEASGNIDQVSDLCRRFKDTDFAIYSGDDSLTLPMLSVGVKGVVSVVSHVAGLKVKEMIEAFEAGNTKLAREIHFELLPLTKGMFITTNPTMVKTAMNLLGHKVGLLRSPMIEATKEQEEFMRNLLAEYKLL